MILGDALRAEWFKLSRNRMTWAWAFALTPVATLLTGILIETWARSSGSTITPADPVNKAIGGLGAMGNPLVQLLLIVGAGVIFAGEYRWQTWRAIVPRAERSALIGGKFLTFAGAASLSIIASGVAGFLVGLYCAFVLGLDLKWPADSAAILPALALAFAVSLTQALVIGGIVAAIAVTARSVLACTTGPFLLLLGLELAATRVSLPNADISTALLPNVASHSLREVALFTLGDSDAVGLHLAIPGALALVLWMAALAAIVFAVFGAQDLSEE